MSSEEPEESPAWPMAMVLPIAFIVVAFLLRHRQKLRLLLGITPPPPAAGPGGGAAPGVIGAPTPQIRRTARLQVRVPPNCAPGTQIMMKTPYGTTIQCKVPHGLGPGKIFQVEYPVPVDSPTVVDEEINATVCTAVALPKYWTNVRNSSDTAGNFDQMVYVSTEQHGKFESLLSASYKAKATQDRLCPKNICPRTFGGCKCVQPDGDPGLPTEYRVKRIIRVEDSAMWTRYEQMRSKIKQRRGTQLYDRLDPPALTDCLADKHEDIFEPLDGELNEVYLWHGTGVRRALSIAQEDFKIDLAGSSRGTMYGPGAYMAESSTKADEYARDEPGGYYDGIFAMLLCRVVMGKYLYTTERQEDAGHRVKAGEFDSVLGDRAKAAGTFREFVVFHPDQVYPEYVVLYSRVHRRDAKLRAAHEFHMEMPVYWANCHKDPKVESFHMQFKVRSHTLGMLQRLVEATYNVVGMRASLLSARRVENSDIWNFYNAFKRNVRRNSSSRAGDVKKLRACFTPVNELSGDPDSGHVLTLAHLHDQELEDCISVSNLELSMNELLLWHGTNKSAAENIVCTDFVIPTGSQVRHGCRYGNGAYFAEDMAKSLQYAAEESGTKTVLLCRVCCGSIYYTENASELTATATMAQQGHHSVLASPTAPSLAEKFRYREFIVTDAHQVYPEYILELQERPAADPPAQSLSDQSAIEPATPPGH